MFLHEIVAIGVLHSHRSSNRQLLKNITQKECPSNTENVKILNLTLNLVNASTSNTAIIRERNIKCFEIWLPLSTTLSASNSRPASISLPVDLNQMRTTQLPLAGPHNCPGYLSSNDLLKANPATPGYWAHFYCLVFLSDAAPRASEPVTKIGHFSRPPN